MSNSGNFSRRSFLKTTGMAAGAVFAGGSVLLAGNEAAYAQMAHGNAGSGMDMDAAPRAFKGMMFFSDAKLFYTLSDAVERIFPKDKNGPGAIELGVPFFIDNQLAGAWGYNDREYTKGPFFKGTPEQGYQTPLLRREIFKVGLEALNAEANSKFKKDFTDLSDLQKDEILKACEAGAIKMEGVSSSYFFSLLKLMTLAGAFADPIYNGNNNMNGWKMKNYPGAQMSYADIITDKTFQKIAPMSLADMI